MSSTSTPITENFYIYVKKDNIAHDLKLVAKLTYS